MAIDGVSLTVFGIRGRRFAVALIPHTLKMTTLGHKRVGDAVNIESDMLVKYVERILAGQRTEGTHRIARVPANAAPAAAAATALTSAGLARRARSRGAMP